MVLHTISPPAVGRSLRPNLFDVVALALVIVTLALSVHGASEATVPIGPHDHASVSLDPAYLPEYALRTVLRMLAAILCSLVFTFAYGALAAKSRRAEMVLVPVLDILQSVPILGFLTFTVAFFMGLFPGRALGAELRPSSRSSPARPGT